MNFVKIKCLRLAYVLVICVFGTVQASFDTSQIQDISQGEADALVSLYDAFNGSNWNNDTEWLSSYTPGSWFGVTVNSGQVSGLDLSANALNGSIWPTDIGNLTGLTTLDLSSNPQLSGTLPLELMSLTNLNTLYLGGTNVVVPTNPEFQIWLESIDILELPTTHTVPVPGAMGLIVCGLAFMKRHGNHTRI